MEYLWRFESDFPTLWLIAGLHKAYVFLCLWDSHDDSNHSTKTIWPPREEIVVGRYNMKHTPLINPQKVYLPPLHIKLRFMKNFVKAMDHHGKGFKYLLKKFGFKKSDAKLKAGVFVGPDLIKDEKIDQHMNSLKLSTWKSFKQVVYNFLGSKKARIMPMLCKRC